jgi:DNA topoisomerase III
VKPDEGIRTTKAPPAGGRQLVIAEKPSVARDLARVLGVRPAGRHAFSGPERVITWCIGHLVELVEPGAYDPRWKSWRLEALPMIPGTFRLGPVPATRDQLAAVEGLLRQRTFSEVVNACDAGREGELIFRYVYELAGSRLPVRRLWISSLTDESIRRGFANLRAGGEFDPLGDAARCRSEADWLVGLNATRAVTLTQRDAVSVPVPAPGPRAAARASASGRPARTLRGPAGTHGRDPRGSRGATTGRSAGAGSVYSIGRVQTPTLAIVVKRELAIQTFRPEGYWEVRGTFSPGRRADADVAEARAASTQGRAALEGTRAESDSDGVESFHAHWGGAATATKGASSRLGAEALADDLVARLRATTAPGAPEGSAVVERIHERKTREPAPQLFDLTSLQRTANRRHGLSATRTLEVAQSLYERHKLLTYPRTDARHLTGDLFDELPRLFRALGERAEYAPFARPLLDAPPARSRRVFDDSKVQDHHAIIPTGKPASLALLDPDERRIFDLVVRRFLGVFHPDAEFALTEAVIRVGAASPTAGAPRAAARVAAPPGSTSAGSGSGSPAPSPSDAILTHLPPPPDRFFVRGRVRLAAGWQAVAGIEAPGAEPGSRAASRGKHDKNGTGLPGGAGRGSADGERDGDGHGDGAADRGPTALPPLREGQVLRATFEALRKQTKPPPHHTEASLLGAMESAGRDIDDEALRAAMKDTGLGTPATRASTIETLVKRGFVVREAKQMVATATGIALIQTLPVPSLASPELTGAWEARLSRIARGQETRGAFMRDIAGYVGDVVSAVREAARRGAPGASRAASRATARATPSPASPARPPAAPAAAPGRMPVSAEGPLELECPRCHVGRLVTGRRGWGCSRWRDGCSFVVWFESDGRRLTVADLRALVESTTSSP